MKALRLTGWQRPPELQDVDQPDPGPGEVLLKVAASGACHSDLHLMDEFTDGIVPWGPPFTLGHETTGWVEALGDGVPGLEVGEPVAVYGPWGCGRCVRCREGFENYCVHQLQLGAAGPGLGYDGGMAPYLLVRNHRWLVPLGDLDPVEAAPLTDAGLTPYHAVKRSLHKLGPGSTAVVIGAGGLGHMAVQILLAMTPAQVVVVDQRAEALELARAEGAHHTVLSGDTAAEQVQDLTEGLGADVTLDLVGVDATLALGAAVTRPLGDLTIVGIGGGTLPLSFFSIAYEVSVATTYWGSLPELWEVMALARSGRIRPKVSRYPLDRALEAYDAMRAGRLEGRAVIVPQLAS